MLLIGDQMYFRVESSEGTALHFPSAPLCSDRHLLVAHSLEVLSTREMETFMAWAAQPQSRSRVRGSRGRDVFSGGSGCVLFSKSLQTALVFRAFITSPAAAEDVRRLSDSWLLRGHLCRPWLFFHFSLRPFAHFTISPCSSWFFTNEDNMQKALSSYLLIILFFIGVQQRKGIKMHKWEL